ADQLGADPEPDLQQLHQQILASDRVRPGPLPAAGQTPAEVWEPGLAAHTLPHIPLQLPAGMQHFIGRTEELERLSKLLAETSGAGGAGVISAISGTAKIGKTALAVHWAHQNADRFPDKQLYVNLRGFDPSG